MTISENIKRLRIEKNITQIELAEIAGVSEHTPSKWEQGLSIPRMGAIEKIADYFQIPKSMLLEDYKLIPEKEAEIQRACSRPEVRELIELAMDAANEEVQMILSIWKLIRVNKDGKA